MAFICHGSIFVLSLNKFTNFNYIFCIYFITVILQGINSIRGMRINVDVQNELKVNIQMHYYSNANWKKKWWVAYSYFILFCSILFLFFTILFFLLFYSILFHSVYLFFLFYFIVFLFCFILFYFILYWSISFHSVFYFILFILLFYSVLFSSFYCFILISFCLFGLFILFYFILFSSLLFISLFTSFPLSLFMSNCSPNASGRVLNLRSRSAPHPLDPSPHTAVLFRDSGTGCVCVMKWFRWKQTNVSHRRRQHAKIHYKLICLIFILIFPL